jgi:hypothetical protein
MYKKLLAVIAAAAGATAIVGFIPPPPPASAAKAPQVNAVAVAQPQANVQAANVQANVVVPVSAAPATGCTQGWPHYEQNCLRDSRRPNGTARVARVVAIDRAAADRPVVAVDRSAADRPSRPRH